MVLFSFFLVMLVLFLFLSQGFGWMDGWPPVMEEVTEARTARGEQGQGYDRSEARLTRKRSNEQYNPQRYTQKPL